MHRVVGVAILVALVSLVPGWAADPTADDLLRATEQKLKAVTETAGPSVACVVVSRSDRYPKPEKPEHAGHLGSFDPFEFAKPDPTQTRLELARKLDLADRDNIPAHSSVGGVVIDASGLVLTTYYAIEKATKIYVHLPGGKGSYADIHAADARSDLAVLKLINPPAGLRAVPIGEARPADGSRSVFAGKLVVLMAYPYSSGFELRQPTAWLGSVGNVVRTRAKPKERRNTASNRSWYLYGSVLELNTVVQPGGKGGVAPTLIENGMPVLGLDGRLLALTTTMAAVIGDPAGPVYGLPIDPKVHRIVDVLVRGEEVEYGFLGVSVNPEIPGLYLTDVAPRSPAALAGLQRNEQIIEIDGQPVDSYEDLLLHAGTALAGSDIKLRVRSAGGNRMVTVTLGKFKNESPFIASKRSEPVFGLRVDHGSVLAQSVGGRGVPPGVMVRELLPNSPAESKLKPLSDSPDRLLITAVNGTPTPTPAAFYKATKGQASVRLTVIDTNEVNPTPRDITLP